MKRIFTFQVGLFPPIFTNQITISRLHHTFAEIPFEILFRLATVQRVHPVVSSPKSAAGKKLYPARGWYYSTLFTFILALKHLSNLYPCGVVSVFILAYLHFQFLVGSMAVRCRVPSASASYFYCLNIHPNSRL